MFCHIFDVGVQKIHIPKDLSVFFVNFLLIVSEFDFNVYTKISHEKKCI